MGCCGLTGGVWGLVVGVLRIIVVCVHRLCNATAVSEATAGKKVAAGCKQHQQQLRVDVVVSAFERHVVDDKGEPRVSPYIAAQLAQHGPELKGSMGYRV